MDKYACWIDLLEFSRIRVSANYQVILRYGSWSAWAAGLVVLLGGLVTELISDGYSHLIQPDHARLKFVNTG